MWVLASACATPTSVAGGPDREPPAAGTFHTVAAGETVWDIARQNGLTVEEIVEVNGLRSADEVAAGQLLFLPAGGRVVDVAPAAERVVDVVEPAPGPTPLAWPVDGVVLREFGRGFDGILIAAPATTPVRAAADGEVLFAGDQGTDYGTIAIVKHAAGEPWGELVTVYGHLDALLVKAGDRVVAGQRIADVGTTGGAESPRLHFQTRRGRTVVDPLPLLPP